MPSPDSEPPPGAVPAYRVFGVPAEGGPEERLLKTFEQADQAEAFVKFLTTGGQFLHVRIEATSRPARPGSEENGDAHVKAAEGVRPGTLPSTDPARKGVSDEPLFAAPRPGGLYRWVYISSLLLGALLGLASGVLGAFCVMNRLDLATGFALPPGAVVAIALAAAGGLTAAVVKLHARMFEEGPQTGADAHVGGRSLMLPPRGAAARRALAALTFLALVAAMAGALAWFFWPPSPVADDRFEKLMAEVEGPRIALESDLRPGMTPDQVRQVLGAPDEDELLPHFDPRVIRRWNYRSVGLELLLHEEKGLAQMELSRRWTQPTLGVRIGDPVQDPLILARGESGTRALPCASWPKAWFYYDAVPLPGGRTPRERVRVHRIHFEDDAVFGHWDWRLELPPKK